MEKIYVRGDTLAVHLTQTGGKRGKQHQAIGYLNDGAIVIVKNGKQFINKRIEVEVTEVLETSTQHNLIFARPSYLA
jgi:uncharacterized protein YacL